MTGIAVERMKIEILHRRPSAVSHNVKIIFVHGISVGAWVWNEHFLPFFADAGFEAHALSLRGHGESDGHENISTWRLADYTRDLAEAVRQIGGPAVLIGHSLGGAVVQNWVRCGGHAAGMVLLASVPPWGLALSAIHMSLTTPDLFRHVLTMSVGGTANGSLGALRRGFFSEDLSDERFEYIRARAGQESVLIGSELQGWPPFAPLPWQAPRTFVLGGADDCFVPPDEVRRTGIYYGARTTIVPHLAHTLMLEPRWESAAHPLLKWLTALRS
ncbi:alpha/beta fold hydrolase [Methylobacterium sp. CB376]|uniref:alpha/beta hydrolase n=1 Tax=unclassified Methylobacterium TaxID=2615210 RepID=UPI000A0355D0|nr:MULTISPECIES: alpha/beta fold hydrolase [Methylobacterium]WFT81067.1 alpha/beta fold hydrolase [Methylobacterium nodulans]